MKNITWWQKPRYLLVMISTYNSKRVWHDRVAEIAHYLKQKENKKKASVNTRKSDNCYWNSVKYFPEKNVLMESFGKKLPTIMNRGITTSGLKNHISTKNSTSSQVIVYRMFPYEEATNITITILPPKC